MTESADDDLRSRVADLERKVEYLIQRLDGAGATFDGAAPPESAVPLDVSGEVLDLARRGKPAAAVKQLRHETGVSLDEATHMVDRLG